MIGQNKTVKTFWIIFFGVVALAAIAVAAALGITLSQKNANMRLSQITDENVYKIAQENNYKRALYAACDSMKNIDADLGKIAVSQDSAHQTKMLTQVVIHANAVNQNLSDLPLADSDNLAACQRFVNQTQDYATYLIGNLGSGKQLSAKERAALRGLDDVATRLYDFLQEYSQSDSGMFVTNGNGAGNVGALSDGLGEVDDNAFTYEKLIYDGPFSESVNRKTLGCDGKISHSAAENKVKEFFADACFADEINNEGLLYVFDTDNGRVLTDCRGNVVQYECYREFEGESVKCNECIAAAENFCQKLGYDVKGVWVSKTQDFVTYVNCATVKEGVVVYPDLVKVAVNGNGEVVGLEAKAYLLNHRDDWDVSFGEVTQQEAQKALEGGLRVTNTAKALIEKEGKYLACYEFEAQMGDRQYYVYVDSRTGKEADIFKVIQNTEGYTVM